MEETLKQTLEGLLSTFSKSADMKHANWIKTILEEYSYLDLHNPEQFSLMQHMTLGTQLDVLARAVLSVPVSDQHLNQERKNKLEFAYTHYRFISTHIRKIFDTYEIETGTTDNIRWLIQVYADYLRSGEIPVIPQVKRYFHPQSGEINDWLNWIDSMFSLYYGDENDYVLCKKKIISSYHIKPND